MNAPPAPPKLQLSDPLQECLERALDTPLQHAARLLQQGHLPQAIAAYRRILQAQPRCADAWYNLGYLLRRSGDASAALDAYAQALQCGAALPEQIHLNRAALLSDQLHQDAAALNELDLALQCRPDYAPALLNLGILQEELGARDQAVAAYDRLLASPRIDAQTRALQLQATARLLHLDAPTHAQDTRLLELEQASSVTGQDPALTATLLHAVAHAYDRLGLHGRAFDAASAANRHGHAHARRYDPIRAQQQFDSIAAVFADAKNTRQPPPMAAVDDAAPALFICGMFRSGSTLIEQALSRHSCIAAGG